MKEESTKQALLALTLMKEIDDAIEGRPEENDIPYILEHVFPELNKIASSGMVAPKVALDIRLAMDKYELFCECQDEYTRKLGALENEYRERVEEALSDANGLDD